MGGCLGKGFGLPVPSPGMFTGHPKCHVGTRILLGCHHQMKPVDPSPRTGPFLQQHLGSLSLSDHAEGTAWHFLAAQWPQTGHTNVCAPSCPPFPITIFLVFSITKTCNSLLEVSLVSLQDLALVLTVPHSIYEADLLSEHSPFWVHLDNPEVLSSLHQHIT